MITLENHAAKAIGKLEAERQQIPKLNDSEVGAKLRGKEATETKATLMADAVLEVLKDLCQQNEEFAEAVLSGGNLFSCMKKVACGEGNYIDGLTAIRKAVQFYAPGAEVAQKITVQLPGDAGGKNGKVMVLDLEDLL